MPHTNPNNALKDHTSQTASPIASEDNNLARFIEQNEENALSSSENSSAEHAVLKEQTENTQNTAYIQNENPQEEPKDNVSYLTEDNKVVDFDPCDPSYLDKETVHPADRAELMESLPLEKQLCMITHMETEDAAEALAELDETQAKDLIENLDAEDAARILSAIDRKSVV